MPQSDADALAYQKIVSEILDKLEPAKKTPNSVDEAWGLLPNAASYELDGGLCASVADAIYAVWDSRRERGRLDRANEALRREMEQLKWNMEIGVSDSSMNSNRAPKDPEAARKWIEEQQLKREYRLRPLKNRMEELEQRTKTNSLKTEMSELQAKIRFQALLFQLFLQRRFQYVMIANRFHRALFGDGDDELRLDNETKGFLTRGVGFAPTLGVLDTLTREAVQRVRQGVEAYRNHMTRKEIHRATERLAEAYAIGEFMPDIWNLSFDAKRLGYDYIQLSNLLISALEVKDYAEADSLIKKLQDIAKDFDATKPRAAVETVQSVSVFTLPKPA
jgi:hypothetical protein